MTTERRHLEALNSERNLIGGRGRGGLINNNNVVVLDAVDQCSEEDVEGNNDKSRKPSYVGLSCAVSGYSSFIRYQSPSRKTSPTQFPVSSPPQVLDSTNYYNNNNNEEEVDFVTMRQQHQSDNGASPPVRGQQQNGFDCTDMTTPLSFYPSSSSSRRVVQAGGLEAVETVTKFYNNNNNNNNGGGVREASPGSDCSGTSSSSSSNGGNLVQKQIERLYGGRVQTVRVVTSPEPKFSSASDDSSPELNAVPTESKSVVHNGDTPTSGSFFAKRFGIVKQQDRRTNSLENNGHSSPLEFKPLKVPAVFRLLRPEFREQLKNNSCQVVIPTEASSNGGGGGGRERVIPIHLSGGSKAKSPAPPLQEQQGRVIPIQVEQKKTSQERTIPVVRDSKVLEGRVCDQVTTPTNGTTAANRKKTDLTLTPLAPKSTTKEKPALPAKPLSPTRPTVKSPPPPPPVVVTSPVNRVKSPEPPCSKTNGDQPEFIPAEHPLHEEEEEEEEDEDYEEYNKVPSSTSPPCGLRERTLLCPIQEEDAESTASGSSLSMCNKKSMSAPAETFAPVQDTVHDGHYFIKMLENEIFKFEEQICDFEEDLGNDAIPDDIRDCILAAIGKSKLLMSQKLVQFRGLCDKNVTLNAEEDPFVPTTEDLAGFWDMVYIQVEHIHALFAELSEIRQNGWKRPEKPQPVVKSTPSPQKSKPKSKRPSPAANGGSGGNKKKSEVAKARDEARRKMLEEKKRLMKQQQQQQQQQQQKDELLFVPI